MVTEDMKYSRIGEPSVQILQIMRGARDGCSDASETRQQALSRGLQTLEEVCRILLTLLDAI
jgi:hypothetical protein